MIKKTGLQLLELFMSRKIDNPEYREKVKSMVDAGMSSHDVSMRLDCHPSTVRKWCKEFGFELKAKSCWRAYGNKRKG